MTTDPSNDLYENLVHTDLTTELAILLDYYRARIHVAQESDDGGRSLYHHVYGVHYDAMKAADQAIARARRAGFTLTRREYLR